MKKGAIVRLVIWSVTALILIAMLVCGIVFGGLFQNGFGNGWSIGTTGGTYANADAYSVGNASISETVNELSVNWISGSVRIEAYDGSTVEISESPVSDDDDRLRYLTENGKLTIQYRKSGFTIGIFKSGKKDLTIRIPQQAAENLKNVNIDVVSAKISATGLAITGHCKISTVSGAVNVEQLGAQELECDTVSGSLTANDIKLYELDVDTVSGDCEITGAVKQADFNSTSGQFRLNSTVMPEKVETDTVSGDVILKIPEGGFTAEHDSISGDFDCDLPLSSKGGKHIYGDGSAEFSFDSTSGDIKISH